MSKVDDELTRRFQRMARPLASDALFEGISRRRRRHERVRRLQVGSLAIVVMIATAAGFLSLRSMFERGHQAAAASVFGAEGAVVACTDETGTHLCRVGAEALARGAGTDDLVRLTDLPGEIVSMPSVAFDGTTVGVDRFDPGGTATSVWTIGVDGTGLRRLTSDDSGLTNASWGPDGLLVAVASAGTGDGPAAMAILDPEHAPEPVLRTIQLPGLTFPSTPRFSPDGRLIMFTAGEDPSSTGTHVYTVEADGTHLTRRTESVAWTPDWSPDGSQIVFGVATETGEGLFVCPIDCSTPRRVEDPSGRPITGGLPRWSPDGGWISFQTVEKEGDSAINVVRVDGSDSRTMASPAADIAWVPSLDGSSPAPSPSPHLSPTVGSEAEGRDVGLRFNLCDTQRLRGIDFLGDGTSGTAWTGTKVLPDGTCPKAFDERYGVAADLDGDGIADSWSGETIEYCGSCEPFRAVDVNGDGREELVVVLQYFSIMQYGMYAVVERDGHHEIVPFRVGEPGHAKHGLPAGNPFTFWVGGDAGLSDWLSCDALPELWLTGTQSPIDPKPGDVTTVKETHVSLETDGIAYVLDRRTYTVSAEQLPVLPHAGPDHSQPDCGLGVNERMPT